MKKHPSIIGSLFLALILSLADPVHASMVYYLPFEDGASASLQNDGTVTGAAVSDIDPYGTTSPSANSALVAPNIGSTYSEYFPGTSNHGGAVSLPSSTNQFRLSSTSDRMTLSTWIYWNGASYPGADSAIVNAMPSSEATGWRLVISSAGKLTMKYDTTWGGSSRSTTNAVVTTGTWLQVTMTWDCSTDNALCFYVNGVSQGTTWTGTPTLNTASEDIALGIGTHKAGSTTDVGGYLSLNGNMDDFAMWDTVLSAAEIKALNTAPTLLNGYNAGVMNSLFSLYDSATGTLTVDGLEWSYASGFDTTGHSLGDTWTANGKDYIWLGTTSGTSTGLVATSLDGDNAYLVFAHYMPCFPPIHAADPALSSYGYQAGFDPALEPAKGNMSAKPVYFPTSQTGDIEYQSFVTEIRLAKSAGIDGFFVDQLWDQPNYLQTWLGLLKAAEEVGGFRIGLMPDEACLGYASDTVKPGAAPGSAPMREQILHWLQAANNSPALFRYKGKPVIAIYGVDGFDGVCAGQGAPEAEKELVVDWLASMGMPVAYMATHGLDHRFFISPYGNDPETGFQTFAFGEGSFSPNCGRSERDRALAYWPDSQLIMGEASFVYYNRNWNYGAQRLSTFYRDMWMWNIEHRNRVKWVQLITWNDIGETAIEPTNNHFSAWLPLNRYYSDWFKTGVAPTIDTDTLYIFHRQHPYDATPTVVPYKVNSNRPSDEVEALGFLTAPATLVIQTGSTVARREVEAGIQSFIVPFELGVQSAWIERAGIVVQRVTSPIPIHDEPARENLWFIAADSQHPPRSLPLGQWTVVNGQWSESLQSHTGNGLSLVGDEGTWEDYDVSVTLAPHQDQAGLVGRTIGNSHYEFTVSRSGSELQWQISRNTGGSLTILDQGTRSLEASESVDLRLSCVGEHLIGYINGNLVSSNVYDYTLPLGRAGIVAAGVSPAVFTGFKVLTYDPDFQGMTNQ